MSTDVEPYTAERAVLAQCEVAGCPRSATTTIQACGTFRVCGPCSELIKQAATQQRAEAGQAVES
ncbi:hypothetical protein [Streptosporangium sp. NPDC051022]|uniref:hypothetical protein n=1 Tax=Streptosporangium sp. NPDC051022 TaxID=3155752 RepID=UPI003430B752